MREDGGPETLDELLVFYRTMARGYRVFGDQVAKEQELDDDLAAHAKDVGRIAGKAYDRAADELIRVMRRQGLIQQEGLG